MVAQHFKGHDKTFHSKNGFPKHWRTSFSQEQRNYW